MQCGAGRCWARRAALAIISAIKSIPDSDPSLAEPAPLPGYSEDGLDLSLIRWTLSLTPAQRLGFLDDRIADILAIRALKCREIGSSLCCGAWRKARRNSSWLAASPQFCTVPRSRPMTWISFAKHSRNGGGRAKPPVRATKVQNKSPSPFNACSQNSFGPDQMTVWYYTG